MRARFTTIVLVALGALAGGALGIAASLAVSDADNWPGWLRPYYSWGWPTVWVLLAFFVVLAVWQYTHPPGPLAPMPCPTMHGENSGSVAAGDVTISGGQGPTAGRDAHTVTGGTGPTAGRDIITNITNISAPAAGPARPPAETQQAATTPISNLPAGNRAFTGRADLLDRLHQQLTTTPAVPAAVAVTALPTDPPTTVTAQRDAPPQVLHGLGGVGKTQLALEYARRHASDYPIRWWIPAEQPTAIPAQLVALARQLGIPEHTDQTVTVAALLAELGRRVDWLLIFDNAEDPHDLHPFWPSTDAGGRVLVTSRNPSWQPLAATLPVDVWPRADAIAFLQRRVGLDQQDASALAEALGDLPLALEQAAASLQQAHIPPREYQELLASRARKLFTLGRPATSEQTIATIWSVSLQHVRSQAPVAEELLRLCAFLAPDGIPRDLLQDHPEMLPEPLATAIRDRVEYQQALATLGRYSLASVTDTTISVHRLVQAVVQHALAVDDQQLWAAAALRLVHEAFPTDPTDPDVWPACAQLLPHALAVTGLAEAALIAPVTASSLLKAAGLYLRQRADYQQSRILVERALAIRETHLGPDHPRTAASLHDLAAVLADQGDLAGARTLLERALTVYEASVDPDPPDTADTLNSLAAVVFMQGDLDRARLLQERALTILEAHLGPDHPRTAASLNNLAGVLADQGDLAGARTLLERALAIREARLGPDHPLTALSLNNLASIRRDQGDLDAARTLHERALAIREARLGPDHPHTASSRECLVAVVAELENRE